MGKISYDKDVVLWSREQATLLRTGQFSQLDIEHLADEIEDVGKSEQRELASRMIVLLVHLLKWQLQPSLRGSSWETTIKTQRNGIIRRVSNTPGLKATLAEADWQIDVWADVIDQAVKETGLKEDVFPVPCPWQMEQVLSAGWFPEAGIKKPS